MEQGDRIAGAALVAAGLGVVVGMAHHPTRYDQTQAAVTVHGALLVVLALLVFGFIHFARRRGLDRPAVLAGLVAYAFGAFANIGAATINGLVTPALVMRGPGAVGPDIFAFAWAANQSLDAIGVFGTGAAFILWSLDLLTERRAPARLLGAAGMLAGIVPVVLLATGAIRMNVAGAFTVYAITAAWAAQVGLFLLRYGAARAPAA